MWNYSFVPLKNPARVFVFLAYKRNSILEFRNWMRFRVHLQSSLTSQSSGQSLYSIKVCNLYHFEFFFSFISSDFRYRKTLFFIVLFIIFALKKPRMRLIEVNNSRVCGQISENFEFLTWKFKGFNCLFYFWMLCSFKVEEKHGWRQFYA